MLETVMPLLKELEHEKPHMPHTELYNEVWLLRVILHWFYQNRHQAISFPFNREQTGTQKICLTLSICLLTGVMSWQSHISMPTLESLVI